VQICPQSSSRNLHIEGIAFGGSQLTLTDVALLQGILEISGTEPQKVSLSSTECKKVLEQAFNQIKDLISKVGLDEKDLSVVLIGGGAHVLPKLDERFLIPPHANVANAYGAALAEISGTVDTVVSLNARDAILDQLQDEAKQKAIQKGANEKNVDIVDLQIIPYHYVPNQMARVVVTASGAQR
jgi:N-methylhydantoinase A/oxoprolinase/acetone carboxylase beta subunit